MEIDSKRLGDWILDEALQPPAETLNLEILTGISAYRGEKQLSDSFYYDIHFIRREMGKKKSHIASTFETLEDALNFRSVGFVVNRPTRSLPHYNPHKLNKLSELILEKLKEEGNFKLKLIGTDDFEILPL